MTDTFIPTMSSIGWVNTLAEVADYEISCFITAEFSQTVLHYGKIPSLQYLLRQHANRPLELEAALRTVLENIMNVAFPGQAETLVTVEAAETNPSNLTIRLQATITKNGGQHLVGRVVQYENSKIVKIAKIVNG